MQQGTGDWVSVRNLVISWFYLIILQFASFMVKIQMEEVLFLENRDGTLGLQKDKRQKSQDKSEKVKRESYISGNSSGGAKYL